MKAVHDWEVQDAERQVRSAMALDPTYPRARQVLSECLTMMGRTEEAIEEADRALELDPLSLHTNAAVVMARYFGRRYERAIEHGIKAIELDANFFPIHFYLGLAYQQTGDHASAMAELQQARTLSHNSTLVTASLGSALVAAGEVDEARQILHDLEQIAQQKYVPQTPLAAVFASLGDREAAFFCIEKALEGASLDSFAAFDNEDAPCRVLRTSRRRTGLLHSSLTSLQLS